MGKKSTPSAPPPPDPKATASAQGAANVDTAIAQQFMNMVGQNGPNGTVTYTPNGNKTTVGTGADARTIDQYTQNVTLSPEQRRLQDLTNQAAQKFGETANTQLDSVSGKLAQPLDFSSLGAAPTADEATRQNVLQSILQRQQPMMDRDRSALETRLANQGIQVGSKAYSDAIDELNRKNTDFRLAADQQAGGQMAQDFGLASTARNQAINEMVQQRQIPLNELAAMLSGSQVQSPQFVAPPQSQIAPQDIMGATYGSYNGQMNAYNAALGANSANNQGLYGLLGSGAMAGAYAFCFEADTPVEMADGSECPISEVQIGDMTAGGIVYSKTVADGLKEPWFDYQGVIVTGSHTLFENGRWIRVQDSANAIRVDARPEAHCLGTSEHEIIVRGIRFGDMDEIDRSSLVYMETWDRTLAAKNQAEVSL